MTATPSSSGPTLAQRAFRRRDDRRRWALGAAIVASFIGLWFAAGWIDREHAEAQIATDVTYHLSVQDERTCAALAAYRLATGDHWDQRAAVAQAALNRFRALGEVPDCGDALAMVVAQGIDRHLWQASLDAVDAVRAGSYLLPDACVRADTVSPTASAATATSTVHPGSARTRCVIGDLAFSEGGAP